MLTTDLISWDALLADGTRITPEDPPYGLAYMDLVPGICARGPVSLAVPEGAVVAAVVYDGGPAPVGWVTEQTVPIGGPLIPSLSPAAVPLGQHVALPDGGTVTVRAVRANAPPTYPNDPIAEGFQLVELDVEVCGGSEPVDTIDFAVIGSDHQAGELALHHDGTMEEFEAALGQCVAGTVKVDLAATSTPMYVLYGRGDVPIWQI